MWDFTWSGTTYESELERKRDALYANFTPYQHRIVDCIVNSNHQAAFFELETGLGIEPMMHAVTFGVAQRWAMVPRNIILLAENCKHALKLGECFEQAFLARQMTTTKNQGVAPVQGLFLINDCTAGTVDWNMSVVDLTEFDIYVVVGLDCMETGLALKTVEFVNTVIPKAFVFFVSYSTPKMSNVLRSGMVHRVPTKESLISAEIACSTLYNELDFVADVAKVMREYLLAEH